MLEENKDKRNKDIALICILLIITAFISLTFDIYELIEHKLNKYENYELDEFILLIISLLLCTLWYAIRREKERKLLYNQLLKINTKLNQEKILNEYNLIEKSKMLSISELLNNIAHHWRQPLSIISASASGMQIMNDLNKFDANELNKNLDLIMDNVKYLSGTIEEFRGYIEYEGNEVCFNINECIQKNIDTYRFLLESNNIKVITNLNTNFEVKNYAIGLSQVLMGLIKNSFEALQNKSIDSKYIFIDSKVENNVIIIQVRDNANGIENDYIERLFEPYFTTKFKSQGVGMGLFIIYSIVRERLQGDISVKNRKYKFEEKDYFGLEFEIKLLNNQG